MSEPNGVAPVAVVQVALLPDGQIQMQTNASRTMFLMMMEVAKIDGERLLKEKEAGSKIVAAPPGLHVPRS